jgi:hypothetical protein
MNAQAIRNLALEFVAVANPAKGEVLDYSLYLKLQDELEKACKAFTPSVAMIGGPKGVPTWALVEADALNGNGDFSAEELSSL